MTDRTKDAGNTRRARHAAILAEVAHDEAEAAEAEGAKDSQRQGSKRSLAVSPVKKSTGPPTDPPSP